MRCIILVLFVCFPVSLASAWCSDDSLCPKILGQLLFCKNPLVLDGLKSAFCRNMCGLCPSIAAMRKKCKVWKWENQDECDQFCAEHADQCPSDRKSSEWNGVNDRAVAGVRVFDKKQ